MNSAPAQDRLVWSLWLAAAIVFVGGLTPFVFGGTSSRMTNVIFPFTVAAAALVACALVHRQGRLVTSLLYFVGGLAIVYGVLSMFAVPLELAVLGSCPAPPAPCTSGLPRALTVAENTGMGFAAGFGLVALFVGFFGLMVVFRKPLLPAAAPPVRQIPPVSQPTPATPVETKAVENGASPQAGEEEPELPAHVEEEPPELPPHESDPPTT
ncbi:MAG TPA: hypothetical protein VJR46_03825 [Candidatus Dormibacteraeota bacterium]|nr:hypothetical protein [Candidatus Dormibacteraeota bacterium]